MKQYINKDALVAEINRVLNSYDPNEITSGRYALVDLRDFINTLETKEVEETMPIAYVVTRCEAHSDYVEKVFFDEDKAHEYCDQFKGNENEYARHITKVEVTL